MSFKCSTSSYNSIILHHISIIISIIITIIIIIIISIIIIIIIIIVIIIVSLVLYLHGHTYFFITFRKKKCLL